MSSQPPGAARVHFNSKAVCRILKCTRTAQTVYKTIDWGYTKAERRRTL